MKTSPNGLEQIKNHEGVRKTAYQDSVGIWTIGVGHTAARGAPIPKKGLTLTDAEVNETLARDLSHFEEKVNESVKASLNQNQFDALVSLCFNIGEGAFAKSTLVRKLNAGDYKGAAEQFLVWNKAGGKVSKGLVNRRAAEKKLFETPVTTTKPVEAPQKPVETVPATPVPERRPNPWVTLLLLLWKKLTGKV